MLDSWGDMRPENGIRLLVPFSILGKRGDKREKRGEIAVNLSKWCCSVLVRVYFFFFSSSFFLRLQSRNKMKIMMMIMMSSSPPCQSGQPGPTPGVAL